MVFDLKIALLCGLMGGVYSAVSFFETAKPPEAPIYDVDYYNMAKEYQSVKNTTYGHEMKQQIFEALKDGVITRQEYKSIMLEDAFFLSDDDASGDRKREYRREKANLLKEVAYKQAT
ncbi:hypothetical protein HB371_18795 [Acinetobacter baumannii]|uniref:hypothetical protein n=1 Tax=Acinetobacter baumannii TaxID=470 RepID=UPI0014596659|nr:hypothetical protein [Acinetobacter baumannii]NLZ24014.1 hypothetical protein [Acinetobacter baumannii]